MKPWGAFRPGDRVIIVGLPLTGKTEKAAELTKSADRVVYFDPMHDYSKYGAVNVTVSDLLDKPDILNAPKFKIAVIPDEDNLDDELEAVISLVRGATNAVLVLDEVGDYRQSNEVLLNKIARNGRHDGIVPVYVSQVATDIPLTVRRLATRVYSFQQFYPKDLRAIAETYGDEFAERVSRLKGHEVAEWTLPTLSLLSSKSEKASSNGSMNTPEQS